MTIGPQDPPPPDRSSGAGRPRPPGDPGPVRVNATMAAGIVPTVAYLGALAAGGVPSTSSAITLVAAFLGPTVLASAPSRVLQEARGVPVGVRIAIAWAAATGFGAAAALRALEDATLLAPGWSSLASGVTLLAAAASALPIGAGRSVRSLLFGIAPEAPSRVARRGRILAAVIAGVSATSLVAAVTTILTA